MDSCLPAEVSALIKILLGETLVRYRNRDLWIQSVQDYFEDVPLCVSCRKLLQLVRVGCKVYLVQPDGSLHAGDIVALWLFPSRCDSLGPQTTLLATALLPNRTTESFERERLDLRMTSNGFKWGCAQAIQSLSISGVGHYQSALIALAADLHLTWQGQHKFWKYVSPIRTYFAWLPEQLARTYCTAALDRRSDLPYSEVHHLQGSELISGTP